MWIKNDIINKFVNVVAGTPVLMVFKHGNVWIVHTANAKFTCNPDNITDEEPKKRKLIPVTDSPTVIIKPIAKLIDKGRAKAAYKVIDRLTLF